MLFCSKKIFLIYEHLLTLPAVQSNFGPSLLNNASPFCAVFCAASPIFNTKLLKVHHLLIPPKVRSPFSSILLDIPLEYLFSWRSIIHTNCIR